MEKLKTKPQNLKLLSLALLLIITPLLPTSLRLKYLYFIINILIIALGAEAGLLSFLQSHQNPKPLPSFSVPAIKDDVAASLPEKTESSPEQSIFFVEGGESGSAEEDDDDDQVVEDHELYHKAEKFIGNFYKQLKMQRQESWNGFDHVSQH